MSIKDFIGLDAILAPAKARTKKQLLQEMSQRAAELTGLPAHLILGTLLERERLGSTGIGDGIAIPHGKFEQLDRLHGLFARLETGLDFEAVDDRPVDLVFLLLAPADAGADHLRALAQISRLLRDPDFRQKLRATHSPDELFELLCDESFEKRPELRPAV